MRFFYVYFIVFIMLLLNIVVAADIKKDTRYGSIVNTDDSKVIKYWNKKIVLHKIAKDSIIEKRVIY